MLHKTNYDTLSTRGLSKGSRDWFLAKRARKLGHAEGGGRLAKFREIARFMPVTVDQVVNDQMPKVAESEYWFYLWNVGPVLCVYCNGKLTRTTKTKDHVIPRARGGGSLGRDNLMPCCRDCNGRKGSKTLLEYMLTRSRVEH
jgi:hypothetical protein